MTLARRRLLAPVLAAALLAGCGGHYVVASAPVAGGTSVVSNGGLTASISLGSTGATVIAGIGIVAVLAAGNGLSPLPPLPMREDRTVNEQDCTKPIGSETANLRCR